jgi:FMN phosphatase YigB (HAD superfamily)
MGHHIALNFRDQLKPQYSDRDSIYRERCRVEFEIMARQRKANHDIDFRIAEVFTVLVDRIISDQLQETRTQALVEALVRQEVAFEQRNSYPDPGIRTFLRQFDTQKTIFLSDFYMSAEMIREILEYHGLLELVPEGGFSSSDLMFCKSSGRLFSHIHELFGITASDHFHIGDNWHSDVEVPRSMGCHAVQYLPEREHRDRIGRERRFLQREMLFRHISEGVVEDVSKEALSSGNQAAYRLGTEMAPLFIGYLLFVAEHIVEKRIQQPLFLTREGEFFKELYDIVFAGGKMAGCPLPASRTLEVSRMSTFLASMAEVSITELKRLWSTFGFQSMSTLLKSLNIESPQTKSLLEFHDIPPNEPIRKPWLDQRVINLVNDPGFAALLRTEMEMSRSLLQAYVEQSLGNKPGPVALIDIGWKGSIQDNIALTRPDIEFHGLYLGLDKFLNPQPSNTVKLAYGPDKNRAYKTSLLQAFMLLEMVCNSPNGSVTGYRVEGDGRISAERLISDEENKTWFAYTQYFQQGVFNAARVWQTHIESDVINSSDLKVAAMQAWGSLVSYAPADLIDAHVTLEHNAMFGFGGFFKLGVPSYRTILMAPFSEKHRLDVIMFVVLSQNHNYVARRSDINNMQKLVWGTVIGSARVVWRFRDWSMRLRHRSRD